MAEQKKIVGTVPWIEIMYPRIFNKLLKLQGDVPTEELRKQVEDITMDAVSIIEPYATDIYARDKAEQSKN